MYLRNNLIYFNIIYILSSIQSSVKDFLEASGDFIDDYKERLTQKAGSTRWNFLSKRLLEKMFHIDLIINKGLKMNFIEASAITREGGNVRRKSWDKDTKMWWDAKQQCMLANTPYGKQDKHLDTDGYIYVCEGDDVEAGNWEAAK